MSEPINVTNKIVDLLNDILFGVEVDPNNLDA